MARVGSHELDPAKPLGSDKAPLEVQVVSLDWKWLFIYPDHRVASADQLVIPAPSGHSQLLFAVPTAHRLRALHPSG